MAFFRAEVMPWLYSGVTMTKASAAVFHRLPHHTPSLNHSLFSGLDSVGVAPAPLNPGPSKPMSCARAAETADQKSDEGKGT